MKFPFRAEPEPELGEWMKRKVRSIEEQANRMRREEMEQALKRQHEPRWMLRFHGRPYRLVMRVAHHLGFCFPRASFPEGEIQWWCHWCGLRGRR